MVTRNSTEIGAVARLCLVSIRVALLGLATLVVLAAFEQSALAYTDPGTGALIWQMLAAGFVGAAFYFRRFLMWFKHRKAVPPPGSGKQPEEPQESRHAGQL